MAEYDLEEFVNPCVVEKLAAVYEKDETYQKLLKQADSEYDNDMLNAIDELAK